ncbi:MAG: heavy-metal-associated domain-containing protein [Runella sp.]
MKVLNRFLKATVYVLLGLLGAMVVYANWEEPPLHARVKPVAMTILKVEGMDNPQQAIQIKEHIEAKAGVTACASNPESKLVSITYHPDIISETTLQSEVFSRVHLPVSKAIFPESSAPECPIPHGYIMAFERLKYALCFR